MIVLLIHIIHLLVLFEIFLSEISVIVHNLHAYYKRYNSSSLCYPLILHLVDFSVSRQSIEQVHLVDFSLTLASLEDAIYVSRVDGPLYFEC